MSTVTRQSLRFKCSVKDCPWPDDKDIHVPWCLGIPDVEHWADKPTHQHYPKKGMGGKNPKAKIVAILCPPCHDRIDNGDWGNSAHQCFGGGEVYVAFDLHGKTLIERDLPRRLSDGAEAAFTVSAAPNVGRTGGSSAPSLSLPAGRQGKEESDGVESGVGGGGANDDGIRIQPRTENTALDRLPALAGASIGAQRGGPDLVLTHEQRVAIAKEIKNMEWNRQWIAGDTGNAWIDEINEEAEQYLSDFGYVHESLANILRVCAAIPPPYRNGNLRYSHHVVVYQLPREDQMLRLKECEDEGWSVAEFRRRVKGTKPKVKKWSLEELRELNERAWYENEGDSRSVSLFLDWLGGQHDQTASPLD